MKYSQWFSGAAGLLVGLVLTGAAQTPVLVSPCSPNPVPPETPGTPWCATEAPANFTTNDNNGFLPPAVFLADRANFESVDTYLDGLGPTYNAQSCRECHQNVVTGGGSQVTELRTTRSMGGNYFGSPGGTLVQARATYPNLVQRIGMQDNVRAFRSSLNVLGDGFVECIPNSVLLAVRDAQPASMRGYAVIVPILELTNSTPSGPTNVLRVGRFGWKSQHGSLLSFSGDAYLNEVGITNPLFPEESLVNGVDVGFPSPYDPVRDPEDAQGNDIAQFTAFMRATAAPASTNQAWSSTLAMSVRQGKSLVNSIGCTTCHVQSYLTARPGSTIYVGTRIGGGPLTVPPALGNKIIHPYSDFLLHDIGTGDGIPIQPSLGFTANLVRTAPLWGLRTRNRLMHDGQALTPLEAVQRHAGQAAGVVAAFNALTPDQQQAVYDFLNSL